MTNIYVLALVFDGLVDSASFEGHTCNKALALASDLNISSVCVALYFAKFLQILGVVSLVATPQFYVKSITAEVRSVHSTSSMRSTSILSKPAYSRKQLLLFLSGATCGLASFPDIICIPMNIIK